MPGDIQTKINYVFFIETAQYEKKIKKMGKKFDQNPPFAFFSNFLT
jgi:hypothetical protein